MREFPFEEAHAQSRWTRIPARPLRLAGIALILMFAFTLALQWRLRKSPQTAGVDEERAHALVEAARLITEPPSMEAQRVVRPITQPSAQPGALPPDLTSEIRPSGSRQAAVSSALAVNTPTKSEDAAPAAGADRTPRTDALADARADTLATVVSRTPALPNRIAAAQSSPRRSAHKSPIPAAIEDGKLARAATDALSGMAIRGDLRTGDEHDCPFALSAFGGDPQHPRVQLRQIDSGANGAQSLGWYAVGASPRAGWRVLAIAPAGVLLLDPQGSVVHLPGRAMAPVPSNEPPSAATDSAPRARDR